MVIHALALLRSSAIISSRRLIPNRGMKYSPKKRGKENFEGLKKVEAEGNPQLWVGGRVMT